MAELSDTIAGYCLLVSELIEEALDPLLEESGISRSTFELLSSVMAAKESASQAEIAATLRVSAPTLSESVTIAERNGYIRREEDGGDKRRKILRVTNKGKRAVSVAQQQLAHLLSASEEQFSPQDKAKLQKQLQILIKELAKKSAGQ